VKVIVLGVFVATMLKLLQIVISEPYKVHQYYVTTSKKYLINSHILFKYFEVVFLQLHLFNISLNLFD